MKNRKGARVLIPLIITASLFIVFYSKIDAKPNHVGFWFILALGMSIGATICRLSDYYRNEKNS